MKTSTLKSRLAKLTVQKSTIAYKIIIDVIEGTNNSGRVFGNEVRPVYVLGSGRRSKNQDHTEAVTRILDALNVKYEAGNDSPRGGLTGNFIKVKSSIIL